MAPEKRLSSSPTTPRKKAKKQAANANGQRSLEAFFKSPKGKTPAKAAQDVSIADVLPTQEESLRSFDLSGNVRRGQGATAEDELTQEERDELFARELARSEGVDMEELRRAEETSRLDEAMARRLAMGSQDMSDDGGGPLGPRTPPRSQPSPHLYPLFDRRWTTRREPSTKKDNVQQHLLSHGASQFHSHRVQFDPAAMDASIESIGLSTDILSFDPAQVDTSNWPTIATLDTTEPSTSENYMKQKPTAPYALLTAAFVAVTGTRSRLLITTILTNLLRVIAQHDPDSLLPSVYLISNHIAPAYEGVELGLGGSIINRAILETSGAKRDGLKALWDKYGDPGDVAYHARSNSRPLITPSPITVQRLFSTLHQISALSGQGSQNQKFNLVQKLMVSARGEEVRFLVRTFCANLRIGAVKTSIGTALARAFAMKGGEDGDVPATAGSWESELDSCTSTRFSPQGKAQAREKTKAETSKYYISRSERVGISASAPKPKERNEPRRLAVMEKLARAEKLVREVYAQHPNFSDIIPALLDVGLEGLEKKVQLSIGVPISPMLGSITRSLPSMHAKLGSRAFCSEFKYDGQRAQVHVLVERDPEKRRRLKASGLGISREGSKGKDRGRWVGRDGEVFVRLFSRHLEAMTDKYPDIVDLMPLLLGLESESEAANAAAQDIGASGFPSPATSMDVSAPYLASQRLRHEGEECHEPVTSFILDSEVVAISPSGELLPFQTLANRSRKDVSLHDVKVKVGIFAFDLMYLNGQSLLKLPFRHRRSLLHTRLPPLGPSSPLLARFAHVRSLESTDPDEVAAFFEEAQKAKCEGIMVKVLDHHWVDTDEKEEEGNGQQEVDEQTGTTMTQKMDDEAVSSVQDAGDVDLRDGKGVNGSRGKALLSTYEPDKRVESWLKVKKDYVDGLGDSLDLVPIGAWHGMGRKATWWSPILLAVYDKESGAYQAVCKCISGFTDAFYKSLNERFPEGTPQCYRARGAPPPHLYETGNLLPDVWFEPREVWEIRGADITVSPAYTAALGHVSQERGLSMRFPRFIRLREDKGVEDASTPEDLAEIYRQQQGAGGGRRAEERLDDEATLDEDGCID